MTDKQFQKILDSLSIAQSKYKKLLESAENEIIRRYGVSPSDIDNDQWIDVYHYGGGKMTVDEVDKTMKLHKSINP